MVRIGSFVITIVVTLVLMNFCAGTTSYAGGCCDIQQVSDTAEESCKVCGKAVNSKGGRVEVEDDGKNVSLCCEGCANAYREDPGKYSHHEKKRESYREKYQRKEPKKRQRGEGYY
ncbi:MAG: hypothetical protein D8M57_03720 [Candidatus Scalindua sp. AMX11]|nr:MAG: hypothetical protein DWQ00_10975 [Candidatus Scalindua sp.]NOG82728.1 hypothetical protein [Planctomycetota bacterium]RZV95297.1 MAG: hypothetical protein EX341_02910 [Candidatus Scalindua sp. SCAELEC01]TDE66220.1 MAG: hypothetical protein D8M57_03720 [Candidatus Scalindua sp. AMX11]GJQ57841.1 MAG: hypothetical protein SCALA701_06420 [Candidatus Scalindua sp.]